MTPVYGVVTNTSQKGRLETLELNPSEFECNQMKNLMSNYIKALTANIASRFSSSAPILECFTVFDPLNLPDRTSPEFKVYGNSSLKKLADHFFQSESDEEKETKEEKMTAEWGHFKYELLKWKSEIPDNIKNPNPKETMITITPLEWSLQKLVSIPYMEKMYGELCHIARIIVCLPVSNAWPERGGSAIKRIKT